MHGRSRRRHRRDGDRRQRPRRQQRQHVHHAEAAQRARGLRAADHRAAASQAREGRGRPPLHAGGAGRPPRRPADPHAVRIHAAGRRSRRAQRVGAEDPGQDADAAGAARRRDRPADQGHHARAEDQPRHRLALRHPAAADRRHAVRRLRPAPGDAVFHPAQQLSRDPGDPAGAAGQPRHAEQDLCEVADRPATRCRCRPLRPGPAMPVRPLSISHQGQFPAITISFNLAPGRGARPGDRSRAEGDGRARRARRRSIRASRAPRRRSSNRSAPCRC